MEERLVRAFFCLLFILINAILTSLCVCARACVYMGARVCVCACAPGGCVCVKLYTGQGFLSDLIAPYLYYPIGVLQNMNTEYTNSQLFDIFPRSFLKNRRVAPRRPLY